MFNSLSEILPATVDRALMPIGGFLGGALSFAFGDVGPLLIWLTVFMCADFITGWAAARVNNVWRSSAVYVGILKKTLMFTVVALSHGMDQLFAPLIGVAFFQSITICAYAAGEFGSIIENLERAGLGGAIPPVLRYTIHAVDRRIKKEIDETIAPPAPPPPPPPKTDK